MVTGKLYTQQPKPSKTPIAGVLSYSDGKLQWRSGYGPGSKVLAALLHPEITHASSESIEFKGYEPTGYDAGREVVKYQEWWITK